MFTSSRTKTTSSTPIPIKSNKARNGQITSSKRTLVSSCTPPKSGSLSSVKSFEYYYKENVSASSQSTPTKQHHAFDFDEDYCVVSCKDITSYLSSIRVHLVNGLNVDTSVMDCDKYFVLCDCPRIKTPSNFLSYSLLETKKGVLAFTNKQYADVMKEHLSLSHHIVEMTKNELVSYSNALKSHAVVLYNSYTDMDVKASYFLYFLLE